MVQWGKNQLPKRDSAAVTSSIVREGTQSLRILLRRHDAPGRERAEVTPRPYAAFPEFRNHYNLGQEYWYAVSIYLPPDWVVDDSETLVQFHAKPDLHLHEPNIRPPFSLGIEGTQWRLIIRADDRQRLPRNAQLQVIKHMQLGPISPGVWTDWVFRIKWSYKSDGIVQVWKDGQLVAEHYGMNTYNDRIGPYLKLGIYKPVWKWKATNTGHRVVYFDSVRIFRGPSTYWDMVAH